MDDRTSGNGTARGWVDEGLISFEQAEAIEGDRTPWPPLRLIEALLYLGAASFVLATFIWYFDVFFGDFYSGPNWWGAFGVSIVAAAVLVALAYVLNQDVGGVRRAVGVLLAFAVLLVAVATSSAFGGLDFYGKWASLIDSLIVFAAAAGAWWLRKSVPTEVALFGGAAFVIVAIIALIQDSVFNPLTFDTGDLTGTAAGIIMWLLGGTWLWLGYRRTLRSANTAYLLGGITMVAASAGLALGVNKWWVLLLIVTAPAVGAVGIHLRRTIPMVIGAFGVMIAVPLILVLWMDQPPEIRTWVMIYGIPGLLLMAGAVVLADRARKVPVATPPATESAD